MRILFLGDIVGRAGRDAVTEGLPDLRTRHAIDFVVVNAENASHGFGLTPDQARALLAAGADVLTLGNHAFDRREIIPFLESDRRVIRPLNYPPGTPGAGSVVVTARSGAQVLVVNVMTRLFMEMLDCPFRATAAELAKYRLGGTLGAIIVDLHGEASSEKQAFGHSFDGQVSAVIGTHTHVPTADARILPGGTAYQTDAGMCGDYDSVIGMAKETATLRFWRKLPGERLAPAEGPATLCGLIIDTDEHTGLARSVQPLVVGGVLAAK